MERDAQSNGDTTNTKESFILKPVCPEESGEGFPYAPENWPRPGDIWGWRVGRRVAITGHFLDRYLYPPKRIRNLRRSDPIAGTRKNGFASKLSLERFIRTHFPDTDVDAFFASFSWKIPSKDLPNGNLSMRGMIALPIPEENIEQSAELDALGCKAGNRTCSSLLEQVENSPVAVMPCNFCCNEPRFCRDCCCNICCKTITSAYGGYSYVKCETVIEGGFICGHITHIDCALRAFMAGTVGGSIGLDVEFYCRRCDTKKDLLSHVTKLVQACESMDSRDDIAKILKICSSILHGSQKPGAGILMNRVQLATEKLKSGTSLEDLWRVEDDLSPMSTDFSHRGNSEMEIVKYQSPLDIGVDLLPELYNRREEDIDQVLQQLKKSQEMEYKLAEEKLYAQKNFLCYLNKQLDNERLELARHVTSSDPDALVSIVIDRANQIKEETMKLKEMEKVSKGFGSLPRDILEEHFNLRTEE